MADRVELAFREAALRLIPPGTPLLAAVSGGADSVALLLLLARYATRHGCELSVAHLDHGLRRGSLADRRFVERLSASLGLRCIADRREVASRRRRSESPEEAARRVRRTFLISAARQAGARCICTGHTMDDQAETILMRLVRGAGSTALTGMAPAGPGPFVKPLLDIERDDLRAYLRRKKQAFREDRSNRDMRFDRNRVRRRILPLLAAELNPRAARHLVKAAGLLRDDALYLDAEAARCLAGMLRETPRGVTLDAAALARLPPVLARRAARLALARGGSDPRRIASRHVEALLQLARGSGTEIHLPGRIRARRRGSSLSLTRS